MQTDYNKTSAGRVLVNITKCSSDQTLMYRFHIVKQLCANRVNSTMKIFSYLFQFCILTLYSRIFPVLGGDQRYDGRKAERAPVKPTTIRACPGTITSEMTVSLKWLLF